MHPRLVSFIALLVILASLTAPIHAKSALAEDKFRDADYFEFVDKKILGVRHPGFEDYQKLRKLYTETSFFDQFIPPLEIDRIKRTLTGENKDSGTPDMTAKEMESALRKYAGNVYTHIVMHNYYWKIGNERMATYFRNHAKGLAAVAMQGKDGLTPETAFQPIAKPEEFFIVRLLMNRRFKETQQVDINHRAYQIYKTIDPKTGENQDIYFDITPYFLKRGASMRRVLEAMEKKEQAAPAHGEKNAPLPQDTATETP